MKKLGLIGGTGPESTIEYYRRITSGIQERAGFFPNLTIESLSVFDVLHYCKNKDYNGLTEYLLKGFRCLSAAGADFACLTGITPHVVFEQVAAKSPIPVVSIVETACEEAKKRGYKKVALLATYQTMTNTFFQRAFTGHGIEVVMPSEAEMQYIGNKIETEIELGKVLPETQQKFCQIAERMATEEKSEAIVLGCTELPLILNDSLLTVPCLDVMKIHIGKLIDMLMDTSTVGQQE